MKYSLTDITESRLKFNPNTTHNPECDILELSISPDSFITYCVNIFTGAESMEYYSGSNYVVNSTNKSQSRHYLKNEIPKKYISVWNSLKEYYNKNLKPVKS